MNHYVDIDLLNDPEFVQAQLMNALFSKLHCILIALKCEDVGISFPGVHTKGLGAKLRLHSTQARLQELITSNWLHGMRDHTEVGMVQAVPKNAVSYRLVSRVQAKSNPERERRRLMRRQGLDAAQALARIPDSAAEVLDLPFLQVSSQSTDQKFRLFIRHARLQANPVSGRFNAYGLSATATVPWF